jgi:Flp pilus assembly protein TadD
MSRLPALLEHLARKPDDRFALYSVALEHRREGDIKAAEAAFRELLQLHPHSGAGHFQLGCLYRDDERFSEAREAWNAGLRALADATDAEARRSVGEIQRALAEIEDD